MKNDFLSDIRLNKKQSTLRGTNQSGMRAHNERLLLALLRQGALPKADIARMTGLSAQTISVILRTLEEDGLVQRGTPVKGKIGQPSVPITLAEDGAYFYGVKIGRRNAELVLTNFIGTIKKRTRIEYKSPLFDEVIKFIIKTIHSTNKTLNATTLERIAGIGIALPFHLWDWTMTQSSDKREALKWKHNDIKEILENKLEHNVYVQNDATAACSAQLIFGIDMPSDYIYFYIGHFIGGGITLNDRVFKGQNGNAAALGSIPVVDHKNKVCQLIDIASLAQLEKAISDKRNEDVSLSIHPDKWPKEDNLIKKWIDQSANAMAQAIPATIAVSDVDQIYIDGWMPVTVKNELIKKIETALVKQNFAGIKKPHIQAGKLGVEAKVLGAASIPLSEKYLIDTKALMNS